MAFDLKEVAIRVRNLISGENEAAVGLDEPRIFAALPTALDLWRKSILKDPALRDEFKKTIQIPVTNGVADLSGFLDESSPTISLADLKHAPIYTEDGRLFIWVGQREQLRYKRIGNDRDNPAICMEGGKLYTRNIDGADPLTSLTGVNITAVVPVLPTSIAQVPASLQGEFVDFAANYCREEFGLVPDRQPSAYQR